MEQLLAELPKVLSVFGLAFFSFWAAITLGLGLGLSPVVVIVTTTLSYALGVVLIVWIGGPIRERVMRRFNQSQTPFEETRIGRIWERYGIIGLGLAAPMTVGAQIGAAIGITLKAEPRRLFLAMTGGALAWSSGLTAAVSLGVLAVSQAT